MMNDEKKDGFARAAGLRCVRREPGELEAGFPPELPDEARGMVCGCCGDTRSLRETTHHDDDLGGYVCRDCGPGLQLAEVMILTSCWMIRRPWPEEMEGLEAWDR